MEGALGPGKPLSLTRARGKRSSALHKYPVLPEILWRATGASEVCSSASARLITPRRGGLYETSGLGPCPPSKCKEEGE